MKKGGFFAALFFTNMKNLFSTIAVLLWVFAFFSCTDKQDISPVVTIDNRIYSSREFFKDVVESKFTNLTVSERKKVVEEFSRQQIILLEANREGIEQVKEISKILSGLRENILVDKVISEEVWKPVLSDSSLKLLYDRMGREIGVLHIIITYKDALRSTSKRSMNKALELAWTVKEIIESKALSFDEAARQYSEDPTATIGGNLGYIRWGGLFEPLQSITFSLEPRQVSDPILSDFGYHLVRVVGMKKVDLPPFEEEVQKLRQFIRSGKGHEFQHALKKFESKLGTMYRVHFNDDAIEILFKEIVRVHEGLEGSPKTEDILFTRVSEIICTIDGKPYDINWFKERIKTVDSRLSQSLVLSQRALEIVLEHIVFRFLTNRYALEFRDQVWHLNINRLVNRKRFEILERGLLDRLVQIRPDVSPGELIQSLLDLHTVTINENFLSTIPEQISY